MGDMTRAEFFAKYGDVRVRFVSYYKYTFTYQGEAANGDIVSVGFGGSSDDIYRWEVTANAETTVAELYPYTGYVTRYGETVEAFYDF
jgi:hypothetical protein